MPLWLREWSGWARVGGRVPMQLILIVQPLRIKKRYLICVKWTDDDGDGRRRRTHDADRGRMTEMQIYTYIYIYMYIYIYI